MNLQQALEIWELRPEDFNTITDYQVEVVAIAENIDSEEIYDWPINRLKSSFNLVLRHLNNIPKPPENLVLLGENLYLIPFPKLTLGAFIDLDNYCASNEKILEVCAILYRLRQSQIWQADIWDSYDNWVGKRKDYFREAPLEIAGCKIQYLKWRENVVNQYAGLFEIPYDETQDTDLSPVEMEKLKREEAKSRAFSWESTLLALANGNAAYVPQILNMPVLLAFNLLSSLKINTKK